MIHNADIESLSLSDTLMDNGSPDICAILDILPVPCRFGRATPWLASPLTSSVVFRRVNKKGVILLGEYEEQKYIMTASLHPSFFSVQYKHRLGIVPPFTSLLPQNSTDSQNHGRAFDSLRAP
jgi:hypothetical protein